MSERVNKHEFMTLNRVLNSCINHGSDWVMVSRNVREMYEENYTMAEVMSYVLTGWTSH